MTKLTDLLRETYHSHASQVSAAVYDDLRASWPYFSANYGFLETFPRTARILEIGPGSGSLIAWLSDKGFADIVGIDAAREEVSIASSRGLPVVHGDALEYLEDQVDGSVDAVLLKAVLEHMPKEKGAELLCEISRVLNPRGVAVIDVPNMDWLFAAHERYMDLTHETGYTRESLSQLLYLFFSNVTIAGSREKPASVRSWLRLRVLRPSMVRGVRFFLTLLGEGAPHVLFESRNIIAVARSPNKASQYDKS